MILTMDVGNSQIFGGIFDGDKLKFRFRKATKDNFTSDELGVFLKGLLRENEIDSKAISQVALCSVVPDVVHSIRNCCLKYFFIDPFILGPGVKTGLNILYKNPQEVGSDRIANAVAATNMFPGENLIIIDFGTANTFCVVSKNKEYMGGIILPGLKISLDALSSKTAKLPTVEIVKCKELVARSTSESIQSGLYFGNLAILNYLTEKIKREYFQGQPVKVIGTGGMARLFEDEMIFDETIPDLVLIGLNISLLINNL